MTRYETLAELVARTVIEFEQRELERQNAQVHQVKPETKVTKQRKSKKVA